MNTNILIRDLSVKMVELCDEVAQQGKALAAKSDNLSWSPETQLVEGEN